MEDGFLKRLWKRSARLPSGPIQLNLEPPKSTPVQTRPVQPATPPSSGKPVPGNFFSFDMFLLVPIAGKVHIASPKTPLRDTMTGEVRWGSKLEQAYLRPESVRALWSDDPERGICARQISNAEDVLGAEGKLGEDRFRFERILDLGKGVVVYCLLNLDKPMRIAYGLNRDAVEPGYLSRGQAEMRARAAKP